MSNALDLDDIEHIEELPDAFHAHRSDGRIVRIGKAGLPDDVLNATRSIAKGKAAALRAIQNMPGDDGVTRAEEGAGPIQIANNDPEDTDPDTGFTPEDEQALIDEAKNPATQPAAHIGAADAGDNALEFMTRDQRAKVQSQKEAIAYGRGREPKPAAEGAKHVRGGALMRDRGDEATRALGDTVPENDKVLDAGYPADNSVNLPEDSPQALGNTIPPEESAIPEPSSPSTAGDATDAFAALNPHAVAEPTAVPGIIPQMLVRQPDGSVIEQAIPDNAPPQAVGQQAQIDQALRGGPLQFPLAVNPQLAAAAGVPTGQGASSPGGGFVEGLPNLNEADLKAKAADDHALAVYNATRGQQGGEPGEATPTIPPVPPELTEAERLRQQGIVESANALAALSQKQADITDESLRRQEAMTARTNAQIQENTARIQATHKWLADNPVDPQRLYHNQSIGEAIVNFAAAVIGGFGSGQTGHNAGLEAIQRLVQQDIDAQKTNINTQKSRVRDYLEQGNSILNSGRLAMSDELTHAAAQITAEAYRSGSAFAIAAAHEKSGVLLQQANQFQTQARLSQMQMQELPQQYADANEMHRLEIKKQRLLLQAAQQQAAHPPAKFPVRFSDGTILSADNATQQNDAAKKLAALRTLDEQLNEVEAIGRTGPAFLTEGGGRAEAIQGTMGTALTQIGGSGGRGKVFQQSMEKIIPKAGAVILGPVSGKVAEARKLIKNEENAIRAEMGGAVKPTIDFVTE